MTAGLADLSARARRRAARAWLLGRLLVEEPGAEEIALAGQIPSLAHAVDDPGRVAADYSAVLLREVPCYESVFTGPTGQMGRVDPDLPALYRRAEFAWEGRWRVAAPDHIGVQLLCFAHLCDSERHAWDEDRPDRATVAVEHERALLGGHVGRWAPVAVEAIGRAGGATLYGALAGVLAEMLGDEYQRLRPDPQHPGVPDADTPPPGAAGAHRLARRLLAPARAGGFLLAADVAPLAQALEAPWRPSDTRSRLRHVLSAAQDRDRLDLVGEILGPRVEAWQRHWTAERDANPGAARLFEMWRRRAASTRRWLETLPQAGDAAPATLTVPDTGRLAAVLAELSAAGLVVTVEPAPQAVRDRVDVVVRHQPGAPEAWTGTAAEGWPWGSGEDDR